jgi:hypothetical protein
MPKSIIPSMNDYLFGLKPLLLGGGKISSTEENLLRLSLPSSTNTYCDSQLDDYKHLPRNAFKWSPPLTLEIRARASHNSPSGTLGFGFWNDPFAISLGQGGTARRIRRRKPYGSFSALIKMIFHLLQVFQEMAGRLQACVLPESLRCY